MSIEKRCTINHTIDYKFLPTLIPLITIDTPLDEEMLTDNGVVLSTEDCAKLEYVASCKMPCAIQYKNGENTAPCSTFFSLSFFDNEATFRELGTNATLYLSNSYKDGIAIWLARR